MRVLISLIAAFIIQRSVAQENPIPSQKQVKEQLQQAKNEAASHIADLEKQITEAKKNKENPETIKELEDQLVMMKKMMGMFARADTTMVQRPKDLPESKTALPKYVSPIENIVLKQPVLAPTKEQARDSMMWYRGRRLNDSMLVTTQRTVVLYSRSRNRIVVQADPVKDTLVLNINRNMARNGQWTNEHVNRLAATKNSFFQYPQTIETMKEFKFIEETYNSIIGNTIDLPQPWDMAVISFGNKKITGGPSADSEMNIEDHADVLRILHQNLVDHMRNAPPVNVTIPPAFYNHCVEECGVDCPSCINTNGKRHTMMREWQDKFLKYEKELLAKMKALSYYLMRSSTTNARSGIPDIANDLNNALMMAFDRMDQKVTRLEELNKTDPSDNKIFYMQLVIDNLLYVQVMKKNYLGTVDNSYTSRINSLISKQQQDITSYYEKKMRDLEFHDVLDSWISAGFERHYKIIKGSGEPMKALQEKIRKFNRFAITIDLDFEVQLRDGEVPAIEAGGKISTRQKVYVSLGRLNKCRWQLYLTGTDYTKMDEHAFRIPMLVESGTKYIYLKNPLRVVPVQYTGPREMYMVFPYVSLNLCKTNIEPDTLIIDLLRYVKEDLSGYQPGDKEYSVDLLPYSDKLFVSVEKTHRSAQDLVTEAFDMMSAAYVHGKVDVFTGFPKLDMMQVDFKMKGVQQQHQQLVTRLTSFPNSIINIVASQGDPILLSGRFDRSNTELEGNYNLKTGKGTFKVVHEPE